MLWDLVMLILILIIELVHYFQNHQVQIEPVLLLSVHCTALDCFVIIGDVPVAINSGFS